jgi:hypothetical protein
MNHNHSESPLSEADGGTSSSSTFPGPSADASLLSASTPTSIIEKKGANISIDTNLSAVIEIDNETDTDCTSRQQTPYVSYDHVVYVRKQEIIQQLIVSIPTETWKFQSQVDRKARDHLNNLLMDYWPKQNKKEKNGTTIDIEQT